MWNLEVKWNDVALASNSMDEAICIDDLADMNKERVWTHLWLNTKGRFYIPYT